METDPLPVCAISLKLCGTNVTCSGTVMDNTAIEELQALCLNLGKAVLLSFGLNSNTKLIKIMDHVANTLKDFGSLIWSTKDLKEFIHKENKDAFGDINKRPSLLHANLLNKRVTLVIHSYYESETKEEMSIDIWCGLRVTKITK